MVVFFTGSYNKLNKQFNCKCIAVGKENEMSRGIILEEIERREELRREKLKLGDGTETIYLKYVTCPIAVLHESKNGRCSTSCAWYDEIGQNCALARLVEFVPEICGLSEIDATIERWGEEIKKGLGWISTSIDTMG